MADIYNFPDDQNDEECDCEACQITEEYFEIVLECETNDEKLAVLRGLFEDAYELGQKDMIIRDIEVKTDLLNRNNEDNYQ
ncbi:hypothetical protein JOC34_000465 [Virgibacillus halotolerans]|uniref:hypothetical protein n=1 Tax=Virgibacillus halotolerans TaxID=1071053 RepID=UPI001960671B|nr:hypothetical protein [Virgibacillus halotolerans]MBM7598108.1 hypothetical protein [Virgibacillus halotolerans]